MVKTEKDIEELLRWSYQDELSKRSTSAAEGIWDAILEHQQHGGVDKGHGAAQRYAHFGLPDPDAEAIEREVGCLDDTVIDWDRDFDALAGDLSGLVTVNAVRRDRAQAERKPKAGFGARGKRAVEAFFGKGEARLPHDRPRDVILVAGLKTAALITMHAIKGDRPDWMEDDLTALPEPAASGPNARIVGECRGKNIYTPGSYCPLRWSPSPVSIIQARADYAAWHAGLVTLASRLNLTKWTPLPPKASPTPWLSNTEPVSRVIPVIPTGRNSVSGWGKLPLKPQRPRAGPPPFRGITPREATA